MATFYDPHADAEEASQALRGLAHATRSFEDPSVTYTAIGELLSGVRSLRQVLDQLSEAHLHHRGLAHDDEGNHLNGAHAALAAADELHHAGTLLDQVHDRLDTASQHSGRIAWHPQTEHAPVAQEMARRWVNVVFLDRGQADGVLDRIDEDGAQAGISHLAQWDTGQETTDAAMENGYVYDQPPAADGDKLITEGDYTISYNQQMGHVALYRTIPAPEDPLPAEPSLRRNGLSYAQAGGRSLAEPGGSPVMGGAAEAAYASSAGTRRATSQDTGGRLGATTKQWEAQAQRDWYASQNRPTSTSTPRGLSR
ncbi:hypothetical protein [Nesterenkonia alkaliphila]|uniref:Uncharacterized protein n=1 Tax=Nesterenkonia alkaliphila TaxID=1463631 RepID=A0A7K1UKK2_9MICC|nr:hypothetical protein [Nesterenkonia alkaliphila]MVT27018.1 hypothetical protein [Nesterenkonia alkaliphila]GFZ94116.1 hypothetical protein GCM10011359_24550 [Nesterenkonia alkaliphila]